MSNTIWASGQFQWEPWETFKEEQPVLNISAPPCPHCKFWKPVRMYMILDEVGPYFNGVRLCHKEEQQQDFSCYRPKDKT